MCGINGIVSFHASAPPVDMDALIRTRDAMAWLEDRRHIGRHFGMRPWALYILESGGHAIWSARGKGHRFLRLGRRGELVASR
jgi:hypothetical protein